MRAPDYRQILDHEVWAYIARAESFFPPDAAALSIAEQRRCYNQMCAAFRRGRPEGVHTRDESYGGVACRRYEVADADITVIYYHGGGHIMGDLESHDDVCAEICQRTGYRVVSVDYRLAPETVFPGCFEDAWAAFVGIVQAWNGVVAVAGDSAGGNLAAAVAHHARGRIDARIAGQVLIYPALGGDIAQGSYLLHAQAPQLSTADMEVYERLRRGGADIAHGDARFAPLRDADFSHLPLTVLITAECDPLASDGEAYRDAVLAAGGKAVWINEAGLVHGYLRARETSQKAAASFDRIVMAVAGLGRGEWPVLRD